MITNSNMISHLAEHAANKKRLRPGSNRDRVMCDERRQLELLTREELVARYKKAFPSRHPDNAGTMGWYTGSIGWRY